MTARLLLCAFSVFILSFLPGYSLSGYFTSLSREERIAASPAFSFFIIGSLAFFRFLLGFSGIVYLVALSLIIFLPLISSQGSNRSWRQWLVGILALTFFHLVVLEVLTPIFEGAGWYGDWWEHYDRSLFYLEAGDAATRTWYDYNIAARTPLLHLNAAFFMFFFGKHFWVFQIVSIFHNSCFVLGIYLLFQRFFDDKISRIVLFFLIFNPWLINNALYTWPKLAATYPLVLSLYFYLKFRHNFAHSDFFWFVFFGAVGSMIHQMALIYALFCVVDLAILVYGGRWRPSLISLSTLIGVLVVVVVPWYGWACYTLGLREVLLAVPTIAKLAPTHFFAYLYGSLHSLAGSLIPLPLISSYLFYGQTSYRGLLLFYFNPLTGAMTITLLCAVTVVGIKKRKELTAALCRWRGEWFLFFAGAILVFLGYFHHVRFIGIILSILGGLGCVPLLLSFFPGFHTGSGNGQGRLWRSPVFFVGGFVLWGYLGSVLTHIHTLFSSLGVFAAGAVPSVLFCVAGGVYFLRDIPRRFMVGIFCGTVIEFILTTWYKWGSMEHYLARGVVYFWGRNWDIKVKHYLDFARDGINGHIIYWVGMGIGLEVLLVGLFFLELYNPDYS